MKVNALGKGYQLSHSLIAFGRGEIFGVGLGGSVEKLHYLPEAHTDFLMAVIGEELGFVGVAVVVALFYSDRQAGFRNRASGHCDGSHFCRIAGTGYRYLDRCSDVHQYGCESGAVTNERPDLAADELWRIGDSDQLRGAGDPFEGRLRKPQDHAWRWP